MSKGLFVFLAVAFALLISVCQSGASDGQRIQVEFPDPYAAHRRVVVNFIDNFINLNGTAMLANMCNSPDSIFADLHYYNDWTTGALLYNETTNQPILKNVYLKGYDEIAQIPPFFGLFQTGCSFGKQGLYVLYKENGMSGQLNRVPHDENVKIVWRSIAGAIYQPFAKDMIPGLVNRLYWESGAYDFEFARHPNGDLCIKSAKSTDFEVALPTSYEAEIDAIQSNVGKCNRIRAIIQQRYRERDITLLADQVVGFPIPQWDV